MIYKKRILLIEDEIDLIKMYSEFLETDGFELIVAHEEEEALKDAKKYKPNLIILDISLPLEEDFWFLKKMKEVKEIKNIPVIVLTDLRETQDQKKALELGAKEYVIRGNLGSFSDLIEKINKILPEK